MRQKRWLELIKDYDMEVYYHLSKANVVVDDTIFQIHKLKIKVLNIFNKVWSYVVNKLMYH